MTDADRVLIAAPVAPLHAEARVSSAQTSQRLRGAPLVVLERQGDDWLRVRGDDAYEGWVHRGYLESGDGARGAAAFRRTSLGCTVRTAKGRRLVLPLGAGVRADDELLEGRAVDADALRRDHPAEPRAIARTALERFEGTPYQWGGVTPWGADCSGLVQSVFALHGVTMPRDAWQQAAAAPTSAAATLERLDDLRAGDLLFFSDRPDRRVTHVGISLGERRMVHLALGRGGYSVERLDDASDPYVTKLVERFLFARRPLG